MDQRSSRAPRPRAAEPRLGWTKGLLARLGHARPQPQRPSQPARRRLRLRFNGLSASVLAVVVAHDAAVYTPDSDFCVPAAVFALSQRYRALVSSRELVRFWKVRYKAQIGSLTEPGRQAGPLARRAENRTGMY